MIRAAWLAAAVAILPAAVLATDPSPLPADEAIGAFVPPDTPMVLTRTLRRPLPGGAQIVTLRSYLLRFTRAGDRVRIDGDLLAVTVDAPPALQVLAELERKRPDTGMFPMWLDRQGLLLPAGGAASTGEAQRAAVRHTAARVDALRLPPPEAAQAQAFVAQLRETPVRTPWPRDLFCPAPGVRHDRRTIPLADGGQGEATIDSEATLAEGRLAALTRRTTTEIAGNRRETIEEWTLVRPPK